MNANLVFYIVSVFFFTFEKCENKFKFKFNVCHCIPGISSTNQNKLLWTMKGCCISFQLTRAKGSMSYCHRFSSIVRCPSCVVRRASSVVRRALTFYIFIFFSRTGGQISTKLGGDHPLGVGTQSCSWGACSPQGGPGGGPPRGKRG